MNLVLKLTGGGGGGVLGADSCMDKVANRSDNFCESSLLASRSYKQKLIYRHIKFNKHIFNI